jgi:hypothetical protein
MVEKILPVVEVCVGSEESNELKLDLYKILAEMCSHKISDEALRLSVEPIFTKLLVRITNFLIFSSVSLNAVQYLITFNHQTWDK